MKIHWMRLSIVILSTALLALTSCDPYEGSSSGSDDVGSVELITDQPTVVTGSSNEATITAIVKDDDNVLREGVAVDFAVDDQARLQVERGTTDASGTAVAQLKAGRTTPNGKVDVSVTAGGESDSVTVEVDGSSVLISGPERLQRGNSQQFVARVTNGAGQGIEQALVDISASEAVSIRATDGDLRTSQTGEVRFDVSVPADLSADEVTLTAEALSAKDERTVAISDNLFRFSQPAIGAGLQVNIDHNVVVELADESGPLSGREVEFRTTRGVLSSQSATTDSQGKAAVTLRSSDPGPATLTAIDSQSGLTATREVEFRAGDPDDMRVKADPSRLTPESESTITATVEDVNGNAVKGATVDFSLSDPTGGTLASSSARTDSAGRAQVTYQASSETSSKDGITVSASVRSSPAVTGSTALTVAGEALRLVLGTGDDLEEPDNATYSQLWTVLLTDSNGNAISGREIQLSVLPTEFIKGFYEKVDENGDGEPDVWRRVAADVCPNEDVNRNGILDPGEDLDGDGDLEPTNAASVPASVETNDNGRATFELVYPQSEGNWSSVDITATASSITGSETQESVEQLLGVVAQDLSLDDGTPPGGTEGPYGVSFGCSNPS